MEKLLGALDDLAKLINDNWSSKGFGNQVPGELSRVHIGLLNHISTILLENKGYLENHLLEKILWNIFNVSIDTSILNYYRGENIQARQLLFVGLYNYFLAHPEQASYILGPYILNEDPKKSLARGNEMIDYFIKKDLENYPRLGVFLNSQVSADKDMQLMPSRKKDEFLIKMIGHYQLGLKEVLGLISKYNSNITMGILAEQPFRELLMKDERILDEALSMRNLGHMVNYSVLTKAIVYLLETGVGIEYGESFWDIIRKWNGYVVDKAFNSKTDEFRRDEAMKKWFNGIDENELDILYKYLIQYGDKDAKDNALNKVIIPKLGYLLIHKHLILTPRSGFWGDEHGLLNNLLFDEDNTLPTIVSRYLFGFGSEGKIGTRLEHLNVTLNDLRELFIPLVIVKGKDFNALFKDIVMILPACAYRNFALYLAFIEKVLREELAMSISDEDIFNLKKMQQLLQSVPAQKKEMITNAIKKIAPYMIKDELVEKKNLESLTFNQLKDKNYKEDAYKNEINGYQDFLFATLGPEESQLYTFLPLLIEDYISGLATAEKINELISYLPQKSPLRDKYLTLLLDKEGVSYEQIDIALEYFNNYALREKYAILALDSERRLNPEAFVNLDKELEKIMHYLPKASYNRDDLLLDLINRKVLTEEMQSKVLPYLLSRTENVTEKEMGEKIFATDIIKEAILMKSAQDKKDFLLWLLGVKPEKPPFIKEIEFALKIKLDLLRDSFLEKKDSKVGKIQEEEFLQPFFVGEKSIFADHQIFNEFLTEIFNWSLRDVKDADSRKLLKLVYDSVFSTADEMRAFNIISALVSKIKGAEGAQKEDTLRVAKMARVFLESCGIVGVKIGQWLARTNKLKIPNEVRNELDNLKDQTDPVFKGIVFDIKNKLGLSEIKEIHELLGSASIKVVYKVKLDDGTWAVLKVKKPEIEGKIKEEMEFLSNVLKRLNPELNKLSIIFPDSVIDEVKNMIEDEMDFNREAHNQLGLRNNLRDRVRGNWFNVFVGRRAVIHIPNHVKVSGNIAMLEEFVFGSKLKDANARLVKKINRELAYELLAQVFVDGTYHADAHAANIMIREEKDNVHIYLIDLGAVGKLSEPNRKILWELIWALRKNDSARVTRILGLETNVALGEEINRKVLNNKANAVEKLFKLLGVLDNNNISISKEFAMLFRFFASCEYLFNNLSSLDMLRILKEIEKEMDIQVKK